MDVLEDKSMLLSNDTTFPSTSRVKFEVIFLNESIVAKLEFNFSVHRTSN
jgi:hypothetical protein